MVLRVWFKKFVVITVFVIFWFLFMNLLLFYSSFCFLFSLTSITLVCRLRSRRELEHQVDRLRSLLESSSTEHRQLESHHDIVVQQLGDASAELDRLNAAKCELQAQREQLSEDKQQLREDIVRLQTDCDRWQVLFVLINRFNHLTF